jgi:hypothetical protein
MCRSRHWGTFSYDELLHYQHLYLQADSTVRHGDDSWYLQVAIYLQLMIRKLTSRWFSHEISSATTNRLTEFCCSSPPPRPYIFCFKASRFNQFYSFGRSNFVNVPNSGNILFLSIDIAADREDGRLWYLREKQNQEPERFYTSPRSLPAEKKTWTESASRTVGILSS